MALAGEVGRAHARGGSGEVAGEVSAVEGEKTFDTLPII